jgi:hypothetical protein
MNILICLFTILGAACAIDAEPIGECATMEEGRIICSVPPEGIPLYASWYDNELGEEHPINCDHDCSWKALRRADPSQYGNSAACSHDWLGKTFVTPTLPNHPVWYCDDRGGAIQLGYRPVWEPETGTTMQWAWTTDFYLSHTLPRPDWVYTLIYNWHFASLE